jgi:hypothetical protein
MATGKPVPVDALTTDDSTTVANPDGTFTLTTTVLPTRMRDAAGAWENIDPTLRGNADGSISTRATPNALTLSGGGTGPVVTLADRSGHALALSLPVWLPRPVLSGASATYRGLYRGIDLVVTAQPSGGFGEVFVIHDGRPPQPRACGSPPASGAWPCRRMRRGASRRPTPPPARW